MSKEEEYAIIGRLVEEKKETETRLRALRDKAERFGVMFVQLGQMLRETPESAAFDQVPMPLDFQVRGAPLFLQANLNAQLIVQMVKDIQDTLLKLRSIEGKLG
ncbi:MAG TPA: hypothetical protein VFP59_07275 [Candidatus Angelobacter sp.]|nr:hypothetical protein [Candidatus Angelobacter sp.]